MLDSLDLKQALAASLESSELDDVGAAIEVERQGVGLLDLAREEGISVGLAKELVELVEFGESDRQRDGAGGAGGRRLEAWEGALCRDEQGGEGVRWYRNLISGAGGYDGTV